MMRIGYVVLNHRPTPQLMRLLSLLKEQQPESHVLVHHDRFACAADLSEVSALGCDVITSDGRIRWGQFDLVDVFWRGLRHLRSKYDVTWFVLLTSQDYPIKPLRSFATFLRSASVDAFIDGAPLTSREPALRRDLRFRYFYQYVTLPSVGLTRRLPAPLRAVVWATADGATFCVNRSQKFCHIYRYPPPIPRRVGFRAGHTPFTVDRPCWHSSTYMVLSRRAARSLLDFVDAHPEFVNFYRRTVVPEESVTATILFNDPSLHVANRPIHFIRWSNPTRGHPDILTKTDLSLLRSTPHFFARKFDIDVDADVLDLMDEEQVRES